MSGCEGSSLAVGGRRHGRDERVRECECVCEGVSLQDRELRGELAHLVHTCSHFRRSQMLSLFSPPSPSIAWEIVFPPRTRRTHTDGTNCLSYHHHQSLNPSGMHAAKHAAMRGSLGRQASLGILWPGPIKQSLPDLVPVQQI